MTNANISVNSIRDDTPICYGAFATSWADWAREKTSHYFFIGGHVAVVLSRSGTSVQVRLEERTQPIWLTTLKSISKRTVIIPALFQMALRFLRKNHTFTVLKKSYLNGMREVGFFVGEGLENGMRSFADGSAEAGTFRTNILHQGMFVNRGGMIEIVRPKLHVVKRIDAENRKFALGETTLFEGSRLLVLYKQSRRWYCCANQYEGLWRLSQEPTYGRSSSVVEYVFSKRIPSSFKAKEFVEYLTTPQQGAPFPLLALNIQNFLQVCALATQALIRLNLQTFHPHTKETLLSKWACDRAALYALLQNKRLNLLNEQENQEGAFTNCLVAGIVEGRSFTNEEIEVLPAVLRCRFLGIAEFYGNQALVLQLKQHQVNGEMLSTRSCVTPIYVHIMAYMGEQHVTSRVCKTWKCFTQNSYKELIFSMTFQRYPNLTTLRKQAEEGAKPSASNLSVLEIEYDIISNALLLNNSVNSKASEEAFKKRNDILSRLEMELAVSWFNVKSLIRNSNSSFFVDYMKCFYVRNRAGIGKELPRESYYHILIDEYFDNLVEEVEFLHNTINRPLA